MGRVSFEIVQAFVPMSKVAGALKVGKLAFLTELRNRAFFQEGPAAAALQRVLERLSELATTKMCFVAGTPVATLHGYVDIENIKAGDFVLSRDPVTGVQGYKPVLGTVVTHPDQLRHIRVASADSEKSTPGLRSTILSCTRQHPFYVVGASEFVAAERLQRGDVVLLQSGAIGYVVSNELEVAGLGEVFTTYNFEVADFHTYFVGDPGVWVHNAARTPCEMVFSSFFQRAKRLNLSGNSLKRKRFDILVDTIRTGVKGADSRVWGRAIVDVGREMLKDYKAGVFNSIDEWPSYASIRARYFEFTNSPAKNGVVDVHHVIERYVQRKLGIPEHLLDSAPGIPLPRSSEAVKILNDGKVGTVWELPNVFHGGEDGVASVFRKLENIPVNHYMDPNDVVQQIKNVYTGHPGWEDMWPVARDWLRKLQNSGNLNPNIIIPN